VFRNMEAQWFSVAEQTFAQYSFAKKLWSLINSIFRLSLNSRWRGLA
jgi:hypothetical protein